MNHRRPPLQNLTYPSIKPVLQYLPLEKRCNLAKTIPFLRRINSTTPLSFEYVEFEKSNGTIHLTFDEHWFRFDGSRRLENFFYNRKQELKRTENAHPEAYKLLRFYLHRKNTRIKELVLDFTKKPNFLGDLREFRNVSIGSMEIRVKTATIDWIRETSNFRCNHLEIRTSSNTLTPYNIFDGLPFKKLDIVENNTRTEKIGSICQQFKNGNMEIGSKYSGGVDGNSDIFWSNLKFFLTADFCGEDFLMIKTTDPNRTEILVERYKEDGSVKCRVEVVEAGTWKSKKRQEMLLKWKNGVKKWFSEKRTAARLVPDDDVPHILLPILYTLLCLPSLISATIEYQFLPHYLFLVFQGFSCLFFGIALAFFFYPPLYQYRKDPAVPERRREIVFFLGYLSMLALCFIIWYGIGYAIYSLLPPAPVIKKVPDPYTQGMMLTDHLENLFQRNNMAGRNLMCSMPQNPFEMYNKVDKPKFKSFKDYLISQVDPSLETVQLTEGGYKRLGKLLFENLDTLVDMAKTDNFWE